MKTAVEWLENEMQKTYAFNQNDFDMFKQAKELEKQQIIDARNDGFYISGEGWNGEYGVENFDEEVNSKQYYNETFNK